MICENAAEGIMLMDKIENLEKSVRQYALVVSTMAFFSTPFISNAVNLAIPSIGAKFGSSAVMLQLDYKLLPAYLSRPPAPLR